MFRIDRDQQIMWTMKCVAVYCVFVGGCRPKNQFVAPPPPKVTVAQPVTRDVADSIEFVGRTAATETVDLRARVNGYLEKILFEDGAIVKQGDLLFIIRQEPYRLALEAAMAEFERAKATLELAQSEYRRHEPLVPQKVITEAEFAIKAAQVKTSAANVALAETAVRRAEIDLGYTEVRAPISGHIGRHLLDVGNLVQAEETQLAIIQNIDPIYAYFDLSELDLLRFMDMLRRHELPDPDVTPPTLSMGLANEKGFPHHGRLDFRELGVDPNTGTTMRRGIFANPDGRLIPGLFARIHASIGEPVSKLLVEDRAISTDQRGDFVLVVNNQNVVEYRLVKLGITNGPLRVVEEGIKPTDWIIVNGIQRARPGISVDPLHADAIADEPKSETTLPVASPSASEARKAPSDTTPEKPGE